MTNEQMTKISLLTTAALLLAASAGFAAEPSSLAVVTGDGVYIRSGSAKPYRHIGKLGKGEVVPVLAASDDGHWVQIVAPESADVWIHATLVTVEGERGIVNADKVRVRARPDLKGELVNRLDQETVVTVKGREGNWLRIAPPPGTTAWVHAQYVRRMTDDEMAAYELERAELARKQVEEEQERLDADLAQKEAEEAARREAEAELARKEAEEAARGTAESEWVGRTEPHDITLDGWISVAGPGLEHTGATHRITRNGEVLALLRTLRVNLDAFLGVRVCVAGREVAAEDKSPRVLNVAGVQAAFE